MSLIELKIDSIQYSETQSGAYVLFLKDSESDKKLPIVIGGLEAHSIAVGMEKDIVPERPLTHDLMKSVMDTYQIILKRVIINKLDQGVFYALLITEKDGEEVAFDSRTSDAVAMAVRYEVPIYCENSILEEAGISLPSKKEISHQPEVSDDEEVDFENIIGLIKDVVDKIDDKADASNPDISENQAPSELEKLSMELFGKSTPDFSKKDLEKMLQIAIEDEQYERAAQLKKLLELM